MTKSVEYTVIIKKLIVVHKKRKEMFRCITICASYNRHSSTKF